MTPPVLRGRHAVAISILAVLLASVSSAQSFKTKIDCGGDFGPGSVVDFVLSVENLTNEDILVDATISIEVPGIGVIPLQAAAFTLVAGQDYVNTDRMLRLPESAPLADDYLLLFSVNSESDLTFDMCDFDVR